jgi:hypothetical protein
MRFISVKSRFNGEFTRPEAQKKICLYTGSPPNLRSNDSNNQHTVVVAYKLRSGIVMVLPYCNDHIISPDDLVGAFFMPGT